MKHMLTKVVKEETKQITRNGSSMWGYYLVYKDENKKTHKVRKGRMKWGKDEAETALELLKEQLQNPEQVLSMCSKSIASVFIEYLDKKVDFKKHKERSHYDLSTKALKHILPNFLLPGIDKNKLHGLKLEDYKNITKSIDKIKKEDIEEWRDYLQSATYTKYAGSQKEVTYGLSKSTLINIQTLFKSIFTYAKNQDYIEVNPFKYFEKFTITKSSFKTKEKLKYQIIDKEQFKHLMKTIECHTNKNGKINQLQKLQDLAIYSILYTLSMRIGECLVLLVEDYDPEKRILDIKNNWDNVNNLITETKTENSTREKYVGDIAHHHIMNLINYYKEKGIYSSKLPLFSSFTTAKRRQGQVRLSPTTVRRYEEKYLKEAGLEHMRLHDFRHSSASTLIDEGYNSKDVADSLGNTQRMVEDIYAHMFKEKEKKMQKSFE